MWLLLKRLSICILAIIYFNITSNAQSSSIGLDLTQSAILNPILIYNHYSNPANTHHKTFVQVGLGACLQIYHSFDFAQYANDDFYLDKLGIGAYQGVQFRLGYFRGKEFSRLNSKSPFNKLLYYGIGSNFKFVHNSNMRVDYEYDLRYPTFERLYRIQGEHSVILTPFIHTGMILHTSHFFADLYAGFQCVTKIRNKTIPEDHYYNESTNKYDVRGPYTEKEVNYFPTLAFGIRMGTYIKK